MNKLILIKLFNHDLLLLKKLQIKASKYIATINKKTKINNLILKILSKIRINKKLNNKK